MSNVFASDSITGGQIAGGVVASNDVGGVIANSNASGSVTATGDWVGGLAGYNNGVVVDSSADSTVSGNRLVGGLVGSANTQSSISVSFAETTVTATAEISGALVGYNNGKIANTYADGSVQGTHRVGGLVGFNDAGGTVATSYADVMVAGSVGATQIGGFAGFDAGAISDGYFNADDSGTSTGVGGGPNATTDGAGPVTANGLTVGRDPTLEQNYAGFDPNIWTFDPGESEPTLTDVARLTF